MEKVNIPPPMTDHRIGMEVVIRLWHEDRITGQEVYVLMSCLRAAAYVMGAGSEPRA